MADPAITVGDILQIQHRGTLHEQRVVNTYYYFVGAGDAGAPTTGYAALASQFNADVLALLQPLVCAEWMDWILRVRRITPSPAVFVDFAAAPNSGGVVTDSLPSTDAVVVSRRTNEIGPANRGRVYIPGIPEASVQTSELTPAAHADFVVFAAGAFETNLISGLWEFLPIHLRRTPTFDPQFVQHTSVDTVVATQRRRRLRRGE